MPRKNKRQSGTGLPKYVRRHGSGYRAVVSVQGERTTSETFKTPAEAAAWAEQVVAVRDSDQPLVLTLGEAMDLLRRDLEDVGARDGTVRYYEDHAPGLFDAFGGEQVELHRIRPEHVRAYIAKRRSEGASNTTIVEKGLGLLRRLIRLARHHGYPMPVDAFAGVRLPKVQKRRKGYLTPEQVADVIRRMRQDTRGHGRHYADVVEFCFGTGVRLSELLRIRVRDISFERGEIALVGKTGPRAQTFAASLEPCIRRLIASAQPSGAIVRNEDAVLHHLRAWAKRLGIDELSVHVLRHSYGTAMAERVSQWQLMGLMGHSNLTQTARYYHARGSDVRGALDGLLPGPPSAQPDHESDPS